WDLTDLFPTEAAWDSEKTAVAAEIAKLGRFKGTLGSSAAALFAAQEAISVLNKRTARLVIVAMKCSSPRKSQGDFEHPHAMPSRRPSTSGWL
ncbi:MAG TPA: hypothetical protein VM757_04040, partial [Sphingomicrobium sp.]|nr:hypothetical protein [Sphingomicrobium sp.]